MEKDDSTEDKIIGLDKTIFFVIVGAAGVLILTIIMAIYHRVKRRRTFRKAEIRTKMMGTTGRAEGIAFQLTDSNIGEGAGEEIDLATFDNEAIHMEEDVKIEP